MGPPVLLAGLVALCLLLVRSSRHRRWPPARRQTLPLGRAVPWVVSSMAIVGGLLLTIPDVPAVVTVGLVAYTGVAATAIWRMANLDRASRWMLPSRRAARLGITAVGLTWLGVVLGLLLRIADMIAGTRR